LNHHSSKPTVADTPRNRRSPRRARPPTAARRRRQRHRAGPARRDRRERRGRESDQDRKRGRRRRRRSREEDEHLKIGEGKAPRRGRKSAVSAANQSLIPMRKWQQAMAEAPHYFLHRRGRRHGHRPPRAPPPPPPCIVANEGQSVRLARRHCHSLAAAGCRRTSLQPRSSAAAAAGRSVGRSDGLGTKSRKENDRASFERSFPPLLRLTAPAPGDSGCDFLTAGRRDRAASAAAARDDGGQHEGRTDSAGRRRHSARAHASLLCRIISR